MVGIGGLEPPTSSLSETRSNQLSYMPIKNLIYNYKKNKLGWLYNYLRSNFKQKKKKNYLFEKKK